MTSQEQFHELSFYTLSLSDTYFIHQHIVDAYAAQTADINTKPIKIIFALAGLYLFIEKKYAGKEVQLAHMQMAKGKKIWPAIILPAERGNITVSDVLAKPAGKERDDMIRNWCVSVWDAYQNNRQTIISFTETSLQ